MTILIIIVVVAGVAFYSAKRAITRFKYSAEAQVLRYAAQAMKYGDINDKLSSTPKSLSGMNSIYLPQIQKDFPEFNWNEFKPVIQKGILDMLHAIDEQNAELVRAMPSVYPYVLNVLKGETDRHYQDIRVHDTVIKHYNKKAGTCYIKTESAVEYYSYETKSQPSGQDLLVSGAKDRKKQAVYEVELAYIQDASKVKDTDATGATCPNCGAPITNLGAKYCEYCKLGVETINIRVWKINEIKEM